jgi:hypothetical protein
MGQTAISSLADLHYPTRALTGRPVKARIWFLIVHPGSLKILASFRGFELTEGSLIFSRISQKNAHRPSEERASTGCHFWPGSTSGAKTLADSLCELTDGNGATADQSLQAERSG